MDLSFLLGEIYALETFLEKSGTFLNIGFWEILKGRPSEIIISSIAIVRRLSLEVISFWEFPSIPKIGETFERLLELLLDDIVDAEEKTESTDEFV